MKNRQNIERIHFLGGEPTINPALPEFLALCKREFGLKTFLGHTNGSLLPLPHLDGANVGVKAFSDQLHRRITGFPGSIVLNNIKQAFAVGLELKVNMILIPHLVWYDEIEGMSEFLASLDPGIPLHIQGYYPVPNGPKRAPEKNELIEAVQRAKRYLTNVDYVLVDHNRIFNRPVMDERFRVEVIWPSTI
jgi:pyruvate formate lyase activating enzyme